ncbi:MAG: N-formyl-4-amino-5-aminomethyl-2-methylpyrimidine deformylase [Candidatus Heimdallarchaeota archaeon LC_2]|nr:MAG: N-formyl-4-amino-5-aminomethyl-2-methylpyrimidine deformylase [Candidatus Heimdallarchaeota archaeon LC_2]
MIDEDVLIALLSDLIKIDSVNPSLDSKAHGENEIADFLGMFLQKLGLEVNYQKISEKRKNLIAILKGRGGGKTLMLNAHIDTVSGKGMVTPFNPIIKEGRMYGRGAYDMKGGLVSSIMAVHSIIKSKTKLNGDVILALVIDEEFVSLGTEELLKEYSADSAIICEPTDSNIIIAHKGFAWINIVVRGVAAHGSRPNEGIDAIVKAGKLLVELEKLQETEYQLIVHPLLGSPSIHASTIEGGLGLSTYPDYCNIMIERRTLPKENIEDIKNEMSQLLKKIKSNDNDFNATFDITFFRSGLEISENELIVKLVDKARNQTLGISGFTGESYWMDSALLANAGIPTVVIGPNGKGAHASIEYVEISSVKQIAEILKDVIEKYCM